MLAFLGFVLWPTVASWYFAFYNWDGIGWPSQFVGLNNFREVASDSYFWHAFEHSGIYTGALVVTVVPGALGIAMILNSSKLRAKGFFRTLFILPVVLTTAVVGVEMNALFATQGGFVNSVLQDVGLIGKPIDWLGSSGTAMLVLIVVGAWKTFGIKVVYWIAGLQTLPPELYEAARVDGASRWQAFRYVTIPLLLPFAVIIAFLETMNGLHVFDLVRTLTDGGPYFGTDMVPLYIYRYAFDTSGNGASLPQLGFASAAGIFYGLATFVLAAIVGGAVRKFGRARMTLD